MTEKSKITSRLKRLFNSLSFRQARTAVFIALVLGIGFSVLQIANDLQNVHSEMDKTFDQSLKSVEESAFQAAFGLDKALANTVVRGLFQQPAIIEVKIMDNFGDVMAIQKRPLQQSISKWLTKELFGETEIYNIRLMSKASGFYAGDLSIEVDVYAIAEDFLERSGLILLSGLLRNVFLAIILALLFHKMLSKPLTNVAELISSGNAKIKPPHNHEDDELGEIVKAHNELSKRHAEVTSSLQEKENRFRALFENANDSIFISDAESHRFLEVNKTAADRLGYDKHELLGLRFEDIDGSGHLNHAELYAEKTMESGQLVFEHSHRRKDGSVVPVEISTRIIEAGGKMVFQSFVRDITDRKRSEEQLKRIAHYDLLTDLPSRVLLLDRLNQAKVQCQRRNQSLAVAYLDLDGFKVVNDTHGHHVGDELLIALSQRMKEALREGDTLARIGGDEFIAVIVDLEKIKDSEPVLKRLLKAAAYPVTVGDAVMQVSASIGVTLYPQDGVEADQLMRHADEAMYIAKHAGKNRYHLFDTAQDNAINIQQESIADVRSALDRREFVLHYQPKVNMRTGEVIGVEALIRWQHPDRGLVPPLEFLPAIEGHAVSQELGEWVIDTALRQISQWRSMKVDLPISVNISAYQLQQDNFATRLAKLLAACPDVDPHYLELEILETSELNDISQVFGTMNACHDLGVRFALDDFGTGYSSLTHLRRLPAHLIKIDRSFVRDMLEDAEDLAIVEGVVALAKSFKREVIAEGVETIAHGEALMQLGCELAQGYGIARPMPADDIPEWVSSWKADDSWQHEGLLKIS